MKTATLQLVIRSLKGIVAALEMEYSFKKEEIEKVDFKRIEEINQKSG